MKQSDKLTQDKAGQISRTADLISQYINADSKKLNYFITEFGINTLFKDPEIVGLNEDQKERLEDLTFLLETIGGQ